MIKKLKKYMNLMNWRAHKLYDRIDILDFFKIIKNKNNIDCYLLDTPVHGNLGDQAITMAELQVFAKYNIHTKEIRSTKLDSKEMLYSKVIPHNKYVFVQGGGFLGELWPEGEEKFRNILKSFQNHKIVVMPQTISFNTETEEGKQYLAESQKIYTQHKNLTVLVREKKSYKFMQEYFPKVKSILVPDIAMLLHNEVTDSQRMGILFCMRSDKEKRIVDNDKRMIERIVYDKYPKEKIKYTDTVLDCRVSLEDRESKVAYKLQEFARAKLIVTDRLHGMIFAAITGTPCIAMNNCNGKVESVYEWLKECQYIKYAENMEIFRNQIFNLNINNSYQFDVKYIEGKFAPLYEILIDIGRNN